MLSSPVKKTKMLPPTRNARLARSRLWARLRNGGHSNSFGIAAQSFASRRGMAITPLTTCRPWVKA